MTYEEARYCVLPEGVENAEGVEQWWTGQEQPKGEELWFCCMFQPRVTVFVAVSI